jgi:hypothetical protein
MVMFGVVWKTGGTVLGSNTSAATPSASMSAIRKSLSQFRLAVAMIRSSTGLM